MLEEESQVLNEQYEAEKADRTEIEKELIELREKYNALLTKGSKSAKNAAIKEELEKVTSENERIRWELKEAEKKAKPTKRLEVIIDKRNAEIEKLKLQIENLEAEQELQGAVAVPSGLDRVAARSKEPKKQLAAKDKELDKLKGMIEQMREKKERTDEKNSEMKTEIKTLINTIKEMEQALNSQGAEAESLKKKFQREEQQMAAAASEENKKLAEAKSSLQREMQAQQQELAEKNKELELAMQEMKGEYQEQIQVLTEQSAVLNEQLNA